MIIIMVTMVMWLDSWNMNLSRIRNSLLYHLKSDIHNTWITQARVPTSTLTFSNTPTDQEQRIHSGVGIACNHAWPWAWSMDDGTWMISYKTGIALISDRHLSPPTLCIHPALATHHGICNRHEPGAWHIGEKVNLPRELKMNSPC